MVRVAPLLFLALARLGAAEESLYSQRASKRFFDDAGNYNISFYHINDVHAHLDQFAAAGTDCTAPEKGCYGGYSRVKTILKESRPDHPDSLLLNAGDEFQGTMFFTYYGGEKIAETLNQFEFDAMTIGNHEFDRGDEYLGEFLKNLTFPIVSSNIISENEKLNSTIKPYIIFDEYELAVIGVTTDTVPDISNPDDTTQFTDVVAAVQGAVDEIRSTTNITRIVALTHIGYDEDIRLASETTGLYFIIGGHSHTLLGDMEGNMGPYPTIQTNKDGDEVFIVTAYRWGEYLGYIDVTYDPSGKVLAYHGAPIHLTNTTAQDPDLQAQIDEWRKPFDAFAAEVIGESDIELDQTTCQQMECTIGDLIAEAMLEYRRKDGSEAVFSILNAGGIRAAIEAGNVTRGEVMTTFPFGNAVVEVQLTGQQIWTDVEGIVSGINQANQKPVQSFLQISSALRVQYNPNNEIGSRLISLTLNGEPIDLSATYPVVTSDFVAGGGDNMMTPIPDLVVLDTLDEVLIAYLQEFSPIDFELDGRVSVVDETAPANKPKRGCNKGRELA